MFEFEKDQKIFDIGNVRIGGQPGQLPTVMVGSIFYQGDKLVKDEKEGGFDRKKAEDILKKEEEISARTGNPRVIDIIGSWPNAMERYIDFIADTTESPFLIDGPPHVRIAGIKHVGEVGLVDRAIYNSISFGIKPEEIEVIKDVGLKSAIILLFNPKKPTIEGRMEILRGNLETKGLLKIAEETGIEKPLIDPAILDMPDPGPAAKTVYLIKKEYGIPAGCGAHNAIDIWERRKKLNHATYLTCNSVAQTIPVIMGADFVLYGPIERASQIYSAVALADAYIAYCTKQEFNTRQLSEKHPLFKIFK